MAEEKVKVRVVSDFINKRSKRIHRAGDELELTRKRLVEIQSKDASLVEVVE